MDDTSGNMEDIDLSQLTKRKCSPQESIEISELDNVGLNAKADVQDKDAGFGSDNRVQIKRTRMGDSLVEHVDLDITDVILRMSSPTRIEMPILVDDTGAELSSASQNSSDLMNNLAINTGIEIHVQIDSDAAQTCLSDHVLQEENEQHSGKCEPIMNGNKPTDRIIEKCLTDDDAVKKKCLSDEFLSVLPKQVQAKRRKLLVLDINGLLADIVSPIPKDYKSDTNIARRAIFKRPFCTEFLIFCFQTFEVGIWSSRTQKNVEMVINFLLGDLKDQLLFCWDVTQCTATGFRSLENWHKTLMFKEIRKLWEPQDHGLPWEIGHFNESNTLLIDDSPYKALLNPPHTAIFPQSYRYQDRHDTSLGPDGDIRAYLEGLAAADNVQHYVEQHSFGQGFISESSPSWDFYYKAVISLFTLLTPDA